MKQVKKKRTLEETKALVAKIKARTEGGMTIKEVCESLYGISEASYQYMKTRVENHELHSKR